MPRTRKVKPTVVPAGPEQIAPAIVKRRSAPSREKKLVQTFYLEDGVEVTVRFSPGKARWSSTQQSVSIATGNAQPDAPAPVAANWRPSGVQMAAAHRVVDHSTSVDRSGQEYTTNVPDEGPGIGPPPPGVEATGFEIPTEGLMRLMNMERSITATKLNEVEREAEN